MADEPNDYRPYAGYVVFPRTLADLTSVTSCPACFTVVSGPVCRTCGLDLTHPLATELAGLSADSAALLDRRLELLGRIRYETRQPATVPPPPPANHFAVGGPDVEPTAPRRSGVQVALLIVGISLLSIAAIFFLVYAFITFGLVVRTTIIGAITVASLVTTGLLRRRLPVTSEGIAALSVVLVYLDVWAAQANDFFGLQSTDPVGNWGTALLVTGILGLAWERVGGPRVWSIAGAATVGLGFAMVAGWAIQLDHVDWTGFAFAAALALSGLAARVVRHAAERVVVLSIAALGVLFTSIGTAVMPASGTLSPGEIVVVALGLAVVAAANLFAAGRDRPGRIAGAVFAVLAAVVPTIVLAVQALTIAGTGLAQWWSFGATDSLVGSDRSVPLTALVSLVVLGLAVFAASRHIRGPIASPLIYLAGAAAAVTLGAACIGPIVGQQTAWSIIGIAALVSAIVLRRRLPRAYRVLAIATVITSLALSYCVGWATLQTWQGATLIGITALLFLRMLLSTATAKAALLAAAIVLLIIFAGGGARSLALPLRPSPAADAVNAAHATGFISILLLGFAAYFVVTRVNALDRRVAFWISLVTIAISTTITQTLLPLGVPLRSLLLPEYVTSLIVSLFLIAALASWTASQATGAYPLERAVAVGALPAAVALLVDGLARTIGAESIQRAAAIVVVLSIAHVLASLSDLPHRRVAALSSIIVAGAVGLLEFGLGALAPIEWISVPIALALIVTGALHLARTPGARSWAWLAPGVGILLVPSLIATAFSAPLWRLVALGVVGVAIIAVSAILRLQAPLLIASAVVLVHAVATFSPQIRAVYELVEWWVWIAIGGAIVVALSIRFEASRRGVRHLVARIADLR